MITTSALYPFDKVVSDYFSLKGYKYLLYADRYIGWISIVKIKADEGDTKCLKTFLVIYFPFIVYQTRYQLMAPRRLIPTISMCSIPSFFLPLSTVKWKGRIGPESCRNEYFQTTAILMDRSIMIM